MITSHGDRIIADLLALFLIPAKVLGSILKPAGET